MKNTIAGASLIIASSVCVLAFALLPIKGFDFDHAGQVIIPAAWVIYVAFGLYFLFDRKFSIPIHIPTQQATSPHPSPLPKGEGTTGDTVADSHSNS